jgi:hypothetical protein
MNGFIVNRLLKLVAKYGMKVILEGLIEIASRYPEDYMRQLTKDLTVALKNYEKRYRK